MPKRQIHVAPKSDGLYEAHMPGYPHVAAGTSLLDAVQEIIERVPNLSCDKVEIVQVEGPLPKPGGDPTMTSLVLIYRNTAGGYTAILEPEISANEGKDPLHALDALLVTNPQVLRRGCRLTIHVMDERPLEEEE